MHRRHSGHALRSLVEQNIEDEANIPLCEQIDHVDDANIQLCEHIDHVDDANIQLCEHIDHEL